jgi:hypothetical protein
MENKNRNPWIAMIPAMVTIMLNSLFLWGQRRRLLTSLLD